MLNELNYKVIEPKVNLIRDSRVRGDGSILVSVSGLESEFRFGVPTLDLFKQIEEDTTMAVNDFLKKRNEISEIKLVQIDIGYHITEASAKAEYGVTSVSTKRKQKVLDNFHFE